MKIAIIGCGVMGSAFAKHFAKKHTVLLCDRDKHKTQALAKEIGGVAAEDIGSAVQQADLVLLAIKPKDFASLAETIAPFFTEGKLLLSILTGATLSMLAHHFPKAIRVRSMPNLALLYGQGVIGLVDHDVPAQVKEQVNGLLEGTGLVVWMPEEKLEALTALSGSGVGFVLLMIEAMIDGGVHLGFPVQESRELVLQTFVGAIAMMKGSGKHPAELKLQVSSPGGTTIAGLKAMEEEGVRSGIVHGLSACYEKAQNMMKSH